MPPPRSKSATRSNSTSHSHHAAGLGRVWPARYMAEMGVSARIVRVLAFAPCTHASFFGVSQNPFSFQAAEDTGSHTVATRAIERE